MRSAEWWMSAKIKAEGRRPQSFFLWLCGRPVQLGGNSSSVERGTLTKVPTSSPGMSTEAERHLKSFIAKFEPRHQTLIRAVRKALRKRFPAAEDLVYDNCDFFVIGHSATELRIRSSPWPQAQAG
jgi:hypothetical protein